MSKGLGLGSRILIGMVVGSVVGAIAGQRVTVLQPIGDLFIRVLERSQTCLGECGRG